MDCVSWIVFFLAIIVIFAFAYFLCDIWGFSSSRAPSEEAIDAIEKTEKQKKQKKEAKKRVKTDKKNRPKKHPHIGHESWKTQPRDKNGKFIAKKKKKKK